MELEAVRLWIDGKTDAEIARLLVGDAGDYYKNVRNGRKLRMEGLKQLGYSGTGNDFLRHWAAEQLRKLEGDAGKELDSNAGTESDALPDTIVSKGLRKNTVTVYSDSFARQVEIFESLIERDPGKVQVPQRKCGSSLSKILVISDLHFPFAHQGLIEQAFREHGDADVLVILGDLFDCYSASRFRKERRIDIQHELQMGSAFVEAAARTFPKVYLVKGNHDSRPLRWLQEARPEIALLMLHPYDYILYSRDPNSMLVRRFDNVEIPTYTASGSSSEYPVVAQHFVQIGDALLGHFEKSNKGPLRTAYLLAMEWLSQWRNVFGLNEVRCLVQAHVHRLGKSIFGDVLLFESGCASHVMDYAVASPAYSPPQIGYVVLYQQNGRTDWNRSSYFVYQEEGH